MKLLGKTIDILDRLSFEVLLHHHLPPNDGGIALGQAVIAAKKLQEVGSYVPGGSVAPRL